MGLVWMGDGCTVVAVRWMWFSLSGTAVVARALVFFGPRFGLTCACIIRHNVASAHHDLTERERSASHLQ
jgi:hypothetical protein